MLALVGAKSTVHAEGGKNVEQQRQNVLELKWKSSRLLRLWRPMWWYSHSRAHGGEAAPGQPMA